MSLFGQCLREKDDAVESEILSFIKRPVRRHWCIGSHAPEMNNGAGQPARGTQFADQFPVVFGSSRVKYKVVLSGTCIRRTRQNGHNVIAFQPKPLRQSTAEPSCLDKNE